MFYGFVITEQGNRILTKQIAGDNLKITRVVMDKGSVEDSETARKLTAPVIAGEYATCSIPTVEGNTVNFVVEYRSDLNGGLKEGFWISGFGIYAENPDGGEDVMIYYGSLGDAKQYASAYTQGTAPDVRRYPVGITVTAGVTASIAYPAEAWMTAEDVAEYFNGTLKPELEQTLTNILNEHNTAADAHQDIRADINDAARAAAEAQQSADAAMQAAETAQQAADEAKQSAEESAGGCVLQITFSSDFAGRDYTVTSDVGESYTGTVPESLIVKAGVKNCNTTYTVQSTTEDNTPYNITVSTGMYFGQYPIMLTTFAATLKVTTTTGALVTATCGEYSTSATADSSGIATLLIQYSGAYAVRATLSGDTADGNIAITTTGDTYTMCLDFVDTVLENNSWNKIRIISDEGMGENYWNIGDSKQINISGTWGNIFAGSAVVYAFIIGFNHNLAFEKDGKIHFQISWNRSKDCCFTDNACGNGADANHCVMNSTNVNAGGWGNSNMRNAFLGNDSSPGAPRTGSFLSILPEELRKIMKQCGKYTDNKGGSNTPGNVTQIMDYLFLLSEFEYHGARTHANTTEQQYQKQYDYYKAGNSKIKYRHNDINTAAYSWCRSPYAGNTTNFCLLYSNGTATSHNASLSYGIAPGFCV